MPKKNGGSTTTVPQLGLVGQLLEMVGDKRGHRHRSYYRFLV